MRFVKKLMLTAGAALLIFDVGIQASADEPIFADANRVLTKYCAGCHNATDSNGKLELDTFGGLIKGGEHGNALTPGSAASSRMIQMMRGKLEPGMPPEDEPAPTDEEIQLIADWIEAGAKGPAEGNDDWAAWAAKPNTPVVESKATYQPITSLAYSSNQQKLAVARFGKIELRDADGKRILKTLTDLPGKVTSLSFLQNDELLIAGTGIAGRYGEAVLIQLSDGKIVRRFAGHRDLVYSVAVSADQKWLATGGYDRKSVLWKISSEKSVREFLGHNDAVFEIAFDPQGERLVTASADATVKIWRVADAARLDTRGEPLNEQYTVAVSPDGRWIVAGGEDNRIRKWELVSRDANQTNPLMISRYAHESAIQLLRFHGNGDFLVSVSSNGAIKIWETRSMTEVYRFNDAAEDVQSIAVGNDRLAVGRMDGTLDVLRWPADRLANPADWAVATSVPTVISGKRELAVDFTEKTLEEVEPNDRAVEAMQIRAPFQVGGTIYKTQAPDIDTFRFAATKGQRWIIEAKAETDKTLDTHIAVLDSAGQPVPRVLLRSIRDSYFTFRGKNSKQTGDFRIHNWEEMKLSQLLYCNGEVVKLYHYPRGPDSGFNVYPNFGNRQTMFDTTPIAHALHEPCFVVEAYPPGTRLPAAGLPQFMLNYENDDEGQQELGTNSRLTFVAPADGEYLVRVRDSRDFGGENFRYRLTVRPESPDFAIRNVHGANPTLLRGAFKRVGITVDRIDNFSGPLDVEITGLPTGVKAEGPITVEENELQAMFTLFASLDAQLSQEGLNNAMVKISATVNGRRVSRSKSLGEIKLADPPPLSVQLGHAPGKTPQFDQSGLPVLEILPGETITAQVAVTRSGYNGLVNFGKEDAALNLPFGVYVDNTGLNGVLIPAGQNERTFFLAAEEWVKPCSRLIFLEAGEAGKPSSNPAVLRVITGKDRKKTEPDPGNQ